MNLNIRLSTAACFGLLTFSSVFAAGFHAGVTYAAKATPARQERLVCPSQSHMATIATPPRLAT